MSRSGRAVQVLADWKAHPKGCTAEHGWSDGYDGPCTDEEWDIVDLLDMIDPMFRQDETYRLRLLLAAAVPDVLAAYDAHEAEPPGGRGVHPFHDLDPRLFR